MAGVGGVSYRETNSKLTLIENQYGMFQLLEEEQTMIPLLAMLFLLSYCLLLLFVTALT